MSIDRPTLKANLMKEYGVSETVAGLLIESRFRDALLAYDKEHPLRDSDWLALLTMATKAFSRRPAQC